jgi:hypothetical protein
MATYFVGDLCYVTNSDEWFTICGLSEFYPCENIEDFEPQGYLDPEDTNLEDDFAGRPFWLLKTNFGDGCYTGSDGKNYSVDSGTLGVIKVDDISEKDKLEDAVSKGLGHLHEWDEFTYSSCGYDGEDSSILYFNDLDIQT